MAAVRQTFLLLLSFLLFSHLVFSLDADALFKLKKSFTNTQRLTSWSPGTVPCKANKALWIGVVCENGLVTGLRLGQMGLSGTIDIDAIHELKSLRSIVLDGNAFSGPIPAFNRLGSIKAIYLSNNKFSGEIPTDYFTEMKSLKKLWLSNNSFTGPIPGSLFEIPHLVDLHLDNNQFNGRIPEAALSKLTSFNVANNKLEGEIPKRFDSFDASSFQGNEALCGEKLKKSCGGRSSRLIMASVTLGVVVTALVVGTLVVIKRRKEDFNMLAKDSYDESPDVYIAQESLHKDKDVESGWKRTDSASSQKSHKGSQKGSQNGRSKSSTNGKANAMGDLEVVNEEKGTFGLPDLMKAAAEVLGNGGLGSAYKAVMANGEVVVVKRMRDMNKLTKDEFGVELRKLGKLRHRNILTPLAYHYRNEEKLMVSEYVPKGSLLYLLHGDRGPCHADLNWPARLKIVKGITRGLDFLHSELSAYELPHGNLKSSNVFLGSEYEPLLSDYGFSEFVNPTQATQTLFAYKSPESMFYQQVSVKCDVYCLGIVILEVLTGKFPSQYLNNGKGGTDVVQWVTSAISEKREAELFDPEITGSKSSHCEMERLLHIGADCVEQDPAKRPDLKEAVKRIEEVQTHGNPDGHGIQLAVPTLRDGYADSSVSSRSHTHLGGYGELSARRNEHETTGERRTGDSFVFEIS